MCVGKWSVVWGRWVVGQAGRDGREGDGGCEEVICSSVSVWLIWHLEWGPGKAPSSVLASGLGEEGGSGRAHDEPRSLVWLVRTRWKSSGGHASSAGDDEWVWRYVVSPGVGDAVGAAVGVWEGAIVGTAVGPTG